MDRNYPCSGFADGLAPPAQSAASWAYERSPASVKPSISYGSTHIDTENLHRQIYTASHQLPNYTTTHLPAAGTLDTNHTSETSIMSFLSAMESRSLQAGPVSASLLPPFRPPSWPAGTNSTTELYLTGALPSTATFPSTAALMSYQHASAYPTRSCAANSPPALQDPAFSTSTSGLFLSPHDPLLHLKHSQTMLPAALAFSAPSLGSTLPVQSSTYRSAQESAPHLLQPQFSLLTHGPTQQYGSTVFSGAAPEKASVTAPSPLATQLPSVALEGLTDDELSDSGGEGMYRERDEFVVRKEDIDSLQATMKAGSDPPAIWKVQKALLQKFVPELRDGRRVFSATNSYLGYFGDAKNMYRRVYIKFLDTVNKREYVRVCSRKPRCKPMTSLRGIQVKTLLGLTANTCTTTVCQKRLKQPKSRVEPPPKKRRKWKEEFSSAHSDTSAEEDDLKAPVLVTSRLLNTRTMKETFKGFVELLFTTAFDEDLISSLEGSNDDLLLPHLKRVDGILIDNKKCLLKKLSIENILKTALDSFPEIAVVTELKKDGETAFKIRLSGRAYNRKTMKPYKLPNKVPQEYSVNQQQTRWFSLYHSLQHYKYHTYLMCKNEVETLRVQSGEMGAEQSVQKCLQNGAWLESLFDRFGELINQVQQVCR
uniref:DUF4211 domain-containing protein n=1 Tax=Knipowitschia caucasica TaxID=637954 RepID=A0AAV2LS20_KNICA